MQELQDALAEEGYSADARKDWLRAILTEVQSRHSNARLDRSELIEAVKEVIDTHQEKRSVIDDDDGRS